MQLVANLVQVANPCWRSMLDDVSRGQNLSLKVIRCILAHQSNPLGQDQK
jgi:hypothetical protein